MSRFGAIRGSARRESWGTSVEIGNGLFRVRLDNPIGPLMINTYAYRGAGQLVVIDPGWPWTIDALEAALRDLGLARSLIDVDAWLYTHTHSDHMGAAGLLSDISDAPHHTYAAVEPFIQEWHRFHDDTHDWTAWGYGAFADKQIADELAARTKRRRERGVEFLLDAHGERSLRNVVFFDFGDELQLADLTLQVIDARGHDPYHAAFFNRQHGWLFCGDVAIATPTPICAAMGDELETYLESLGRLAKLGAQVLLPGHGIQRGSDLWQAFDRSRDHQQTYRTIALEALDGDGEPLGLHDIGLRCTPDGKRTDNGARWAVHLALLDTHLNGLVREGIVVRDDAPRYRLA